MSQLADIRLAQEKLEESFSRRMAELEAQLHVGGPAKDTVAKVAEEFRGFRELMFSMLSLLRKQISECSRSMDVLESRQRRKALLFLGVREAENEDCRTTVFEILNGMKLPNVSTSSIGECHRIGTAKQDHHRPVLVWFSTVDHRSAVWKAKTRLKGTPVSVREFLTPSRQAIFGRARQYFGLRACWTQDGVIIVKSSDGNRHKVTCSDDFNSLTLRYPKVATGTTMARQVGGNTEPSKTNNSRK